MAVGIQSDSGVKIWFPGETTGHTGLGASVSVPTADSNTSEISTSVSGLRTFFDARVDTEETTRAAINTRVSTLSTRIVASGILPTGV